MLGATFQRNEPASHARVLVSLAQRAGVRSGLADAAAVLADPAEHNSFLRLARELGVEGLVLNALKTSLPGGSLPADMARDLNSRLEQLRRQALLWDLERDRVLHVLARRGITPLLLKGSALRELVYDDATERSMGDLDLLVTPEEIEPSMAALRDAGYVSKSAELLDAYRLRHFHHLLTHPRGFIVELHWALTEPGSRVPLDERQFFARASTSNGRNKMPVRVPSMEDLLVHVVSQNDEDAFGLLRRIVDVDRIVARSPRLDWPYVTQAAREAGLDLALAMSLRLAELLLRTDVPSELSHGIGIPIVSRVHVAMLDPVAWVTSLPSERRPTAFDAFRLWCASTWSTRARRVAETMRGSQPFATIVDDAEVPHRHEGGGGTLRITKLGIYHLFVYWRSSLALASPAGRRRLRFWS